MAELTDEQVSGPQELSDADVSAPPGFPTSETFASAAYAKQYAKGGLEAAATYGPEEAAGLAGAARLIGGLAVGIPLGMAEGIANLFIQSHHQTFGGPDGKGLTPDEMLDFGRNAALLEIGSGKIFPKVAKDVPSPFQQFHDQVSRPIAQAIVDKVKPIDPPVQVEVPHDPTIAMSRFPPPGVPRSELALTGDAHVDKIVNGVKVLLDNPIIDRTRDVPGGVRVDKGVTYIDLNVPHAIEADGKVFDPADPLAVRGAVEYHTAKVLREGGMSEEAAAQVAADKGRQAETAWYEAHGIDRDNVQLPQAEVEAPSDRQTARADNIIDKAEIEQPPPLPQASPIQEAHDLGVIGGPRQEVPTDSPAVAAQRAMPSTQRQGDKITHTPAGEPIADFEERFNNRFDQITDPAHVHQFIGEMATENAPVGEAPFGRISTKSVQLLGDAAGIDPALIDRKALKRLDTTTKVRMAKQTLDQALQKYLEAGEKYADEPTAENEAEMLTHKIRRDYVLEQLLGSKKKEWGERVLSNLQEARGKGAKELKDELPGEEKLEKEEPLIPKDLEELIKEAQTFVAQTAQKGTAHPLDKLVERAEGLVKEATPKDPKEPPPKMDADVKSLVDAAQKAMKKLRPKPTELEPRARVEPGAEEKLESLIRQAERTVTAGVKEGKPVREAMPKELADMIEAAENVTSHFGGLGLRKALDQLNARRGQTSETLRQEANSMRGLSNAQAARILTDMRGKQQPWYYWIWLNNILSGEVTHSRYVLTNYGFATMDRVAAPALASLIGKLHGGEKVFFGEPIQGMLGLTQSLPQALRAGQAAFKNGMRMPTSAEMQLADRLLAQGEQLPRDLLFTQDPAFGTKGAPNWGFWQQLFNDHQLQTAEKVFGFPGRSAGAIHSTFKLMGIEASMRARAYREAAMEGGSPFSQEFKDRFDYHYANPSEENLRGAIQDGYSGTFMGKLGPWEEKIARMTRDTPGLRWAFPFMHIPFNIVGQTVKYSPAAWLRSDVRAALSGAEGNAARDLAISKMIIGAGLLGSGIWLGMKGLSTGEYPRDQKERDEWRVNNKIPNAVKIGDRWWSMERMGPAANLMIYGAEMAAVLRRYDKPDTTREEYWGKVVEHGLMAAFNLAANETGLVSVRQFYDWIEGKQTLGQYAGGQVSTLIPFSSFMYQTASAVDPYLRDGKGFLNQLKMRVPGLRNTIMPKLDPLYGEPVENPGYRTIIKIASTTDADPIKQELNRIGYHVTAPKPVIGGVQLTPDQYQRYQATAGPLVKEGLRELMGSEDWREASTDEQAQLVKATIQEAREQAKIAVQAESVLRDGPDNLIEKGLARERKLAGESK